jgi:hypothetical protein
MIFFYEIFCCLVQTFLMRFPYKIICFSCLMRFSYEIVCVLQYNCRTKYVHSAAQFSSKMSLFGYTLLFLAARIFHAFWNL